MPPPPPETSDPEISVDLPGKVARKKLKIGEEKEGKLKMEGGKVKFQNEKRTIFFFFFFFCFSIFKTGKIKTAKIVPK